MILGSLAFNRRGGSDNTGVVTLNVGNGSTMTTVPAITIRFDSVPKVGIGIGATAPSEALEVYGNLKVTDGNYIKLPKISTDPTSGMVAGDLIYNSTSNLVKVYNGSNWVSL